MSRRPEQGGRQLFILGGVTTRRWMLVSTDDADYIVYPADTTPPHARRIVMHEVGRLLDHTVGPDEATVPQDQGNLADQAAVRTLLPDLSPQPIRRLLDRTM